VSRSKSTQLTGVVIVLLALLVAGCGGGKKSAATTTATTTSASGASIQAPASIKSAGTLVFCSDITYPPEE